MIKVGPGQTTAASTPGQLQERFMVRHCDAANTREQAAVARLQDIAWEAKQEGREAPITKPADHGFADASDAISAPSRAARTRLHVAPPPWQDKAASARVLLICASACTDGPRPGEDSGTWRLNTMARDIVQGAGMQAELLDLSLVSAEHGRQVQPCKSRVSSAMPRRHGPQSCELNEALSQADDGMAELYERWVAAHAVIILAPSCCYESACPVKLMIDRLVCAAAGEPKHLAGRAYAVVVHGDAAGVQAARRKLTGWLDRMGMIDAGQATRRDRYIGNYDLYSRSHDALDRDAAVQEEMRNVARSVVLAVKTMRSDRPRPGPQQRSRLWPK